MKKNLQFISRCRVLFCLLFLLFIQPAKAQLTNFQKTTTKCYTGPTASMDNTTGTLVGNVGFTSADIPIGHKIVDVVVEIVWTKADNGSCTSITGVPADISHVGFVIQAPFGPVRYLAASNMIGPFVGTTSSFSGLSNIVQDTIVFQDGGNSLLPASLPVFGRDTVRPNLDPLHFYCGSSPHGLWQIGGIDDAPSFGPKLCIHSYCITIVTCDATQLKASCKVNSTVGTGATGVHSFEFADLDSISDVSCLVDTMTFSPSTISCSDIGSSIPVTMTIRDHLNNVESCISLVSVVDNVSPVISQCAPNILGTLYLDATGRDTFWASSILATDNCGVSIKEVRPLSGGLWRPFLPVNCVVGLHQFSAQVIDSSGNIANCDLIVKVIDTIAPTAVCGQDTAYLTNNANGAVVVSAVNVDGGSIDVCPPIFNRWIGSQFAPPPIYTCADLGIDTVRLIIADASGNLDTCDNAVITILDTIKPIVICKNDTVYLNSSGLATVFVNDVDNNSIDLCGIDSIDINGFSSIDFDCSHVNDNQQVTLTAFDASKNTDFCIAWVTVVDTFPPIANCKNISIYLDATGTAIVPAVNLNNGSIDLCTGTNLTFEIGGDSTMILDCSSISNNPNITVLTVIDSFGNSSTCSANISVWDTIAPLTSCINASIYLDTSGNATLYATDLSGGSWDNCGVIDSFINALGNRFTNFNCATIFTPQSATLIITDAQNTGSCIATVDVIDTIRPVALCKTAVVVQLDAAGVGTVLPAAIDSSSTDNCGLVEYLINNSSSRGYTCADLGTETVNLTVRDSSGNTASCVAQITIQDNIAPTASCIAAGNLDIYLDVSCQASVPATIFNNGSTDNCNLTNASYSVGGLLNATFTAANLATNPNLITLTVTDSSGNSTTCNTSVNVRDSILSTITCVADTLQLGSLGNATLLPTMVLGTFTGNCSNGLVYTLNGGQASVSFSCLDIGSNPITLTATDSSGNSSFCTTTVLVEDKIAPIASCRSTQTLGLNPGGSFGILSTSLIDLGSSDNCTISSYILSKDTFNCTDVYTNPHTVTLTVIDASGNVDSCTSQVTVKDNTNPAVFCQMATIYLGAGTGTAILTPGEVLVAPTGDNCMVLSSAFAGQNSNIIYTCDSIGTHSVTVVVTDISGNTANCTTTITVLDTVSPVASCNTIPYTVQLDLLGNGFVTPQNIDNGSSDFCGISNRLINGMDSVFYSCANVGNNVVTLLVLDTSGNSDACVASIMVNDPINPIALCHDTILYMDNTGIVTITPDIINAGSFDNCSFTSTINGFPSVNFDCSQLGMNSVQLVVTDNLGNTSQCAANVTFWDTIAPTANCVGVGNLIAYLDNTCIATIPATAINNGSIDNCTGPLTYTVGGLSTVVFNTTNLASNPNQVILSVQDIMGNSSTCTTSIMVSDTIAPIAICKNDSVYLNSSGVVTVFANNINNNSIENCGIDSLNINGVSSVNFNCSHANNDQQAILNVFDASGNADSCIAWVTVIDTFPPIANCRNISVYLDAAGIATVYADSLNNGSIDLCTGTNLTFEIGGNSTTVLDCSNINNNPNLMILTVIDSFGNSSTCNAFVSVLDTITPLASCTNAAIYLNNSGIASLYAADLSGGSWDNCGVTDSFINVLGNAFTTFNCATIFTPQSATLIVADAQGNMENCVAIVDVIDTIRPFAFCEAALVAQLDAAGIVTVLPAAIDSNSIDNCGLVEYLINNSSSAIYTCADLGAQTATLTVRDSSGNTATCITMVSVVDTILPTAICQTETVYINNSGIVTINTDSVLVFPATNDNCGIASTTFSTGNVITYTCDSIGTRTVEALVTDNFGNTSSCITTVTVVDTIAPIASCRPVAFVLQLDSFGVGYVTPSDINNGSSDLCNLDTMLINGVDSFYFNCNNLGVNTVVLSVLDPSGNQSTCTGDVIVVDVINPIALCHDTTIYLNATGVATLFLADVEAGSSDNCSFTSSINNQTSISYNCPQIGIDTVQLILTDNSGNTSQCAASVTILDTISPTAICQDDTLYYSGTTLNINAMSLDGGSFDNCILQSFTLSQNRFNCPNIGVNPIVLTVTDSEGNSSTCISTVTILDTTAVAVAGSTQLLCAEDSTTLNATAPPSSLVGIWSSNSGAIIANPNAANTLITNIPVGTTTFYWTLSNATCTNLSIDSVIIEVVPASPDIVNAGDDQNLCQDTTTTLGASALNVSAGVWSQTIAQSNAGVVITNPTDALAPISGLIPGNAYTFVWELTNGLCGVYASDTVIVTIDERPNDQADGGADVTCSPDTIHLAASFSAMGGIGKWSALSAAFVEDSSSATSMASNFEQDTTMMIWSLSSGVCVDYSSDTMYVILDDVWPISRVDNFSLIPDGTISTIDVILNDALPSNWEIFIQTPMTDGQMTNLYNGQFEIDLNNVVLNQYFVYEICNTDCPDVCDTALATIAIQSPGDCYIPTAFTPNNDGKNDLFVIPCLENTTKKVGLAIFNRWGSLVFKTDKYASDWDGTHENNPLPDGVYFYILQIEEKTPQNGSIEIKR